jgi:hypothetical protein
MPNLVNPAETAGLQILILQLCIEVAVKEAESR